MSRKFWENDSDYERIMQILDDYWLTEKDELFVEAYFHFVHSNGEEQKKHILWENPKVSAKRKVPEPVLFSPMAYRNRLTARGEDGKAYFAGDTNMGKDEIIDMLCDKLATIEEMLLKGELLETKLKRNRLSEEVD